MQTLTFILLSYFCELMEVFPSNSEGSLWTNRAVRQQKRSWQPHPPSACSLHPSLTVTKLHHQEKHAEETWDSTDLWLSFGKCSHSDEQIRSNLTFSVLCKNSLACRLKQSGIKLLIFHLSVLPLRATASFHQLNHWSEMYTFSLRAVLLHI